MNKWPHKVYTYTPEEVQELCVGNTEWQEFRLSLKGLPTFRKLERCNDWLQEHTKFDGAAWILERPAAIQVSNYINALKRGGQLNMELEVVK